MQRESHPPPTCIHTHTHTHTHTKSSTPSIEHGRVTLHANGSAVSAPQRKHGTPHSRPEENTGPSLGNHAKLTCRMQRYSRLPQEEEERVRTCVRRDRPTQAVALAPHNFKNTVATPHTHPETRIRITAKKKTKKNFYVGKGVTKTRKSGMLFRMLFVSGQNAQARRERIHRILPRAQRRWYVDKGNGVEPDTLCTRTPPIVARHIVQHVNTNHARRSGTSCWAVGTMAKHRANTYRMPSTEPQLRVRVTTRRTALHAHKCPTKKKKHCTK